MKIIELIQSKPEGRFFKVTLQDDTEQPSQERCVILEWEQSNAKWYAPEPFEGRREVGYCSDICLDGQKWHAVDAR